MKKSERYKLIKKVLNEGDFHFTVLNKTGDNWNHVRIHGLGDIWPGTGTYRINGIYHKRDFNGMYERLTGNLLHNQQNIKKTEIDRLWSVINDLLKRVEDLEIDVHSPFTPTK